MRAGRVSGSAMRTPFLLLVLTLAAAPAPRVAFYAAAALDEQTEATVRAELPGCRPICLFTRSQYDAILMDRLLWLRLLHLLAEGWDFGLRAGAKPPKDADLCSARQLLRDATDGSYEMSLFTTGEAAAPVLQPTKTALCGDNWTCVSIPIDRQHAVRVGTRYRQWAAGVVAEWTSDKPIPQPPPAACSAADSARFHSDWLPALVSAYKMLGTPAQQKTATTPAAATLSAVVALPPRRLAPSAPFPKGGALATKSGAVHPQLYSLLLLAAVPLVLA